MFNKSLELANALWEKDYVLRCQHFSFGFYKSRLIGVGRNKNCTHPLNLRNPIYINGEIYQFKNICSELSLFLSLRNTTNIPFSKISIINVRLGRNKEIRMSRPCSSCFNLIRYLRPKNVYFTNDDGNFEKYS